MTSARKNNLMTMKQISMGKKGYGIHQINTEFSPTNNLLRDKNALAGKRVLQEKIYTKLG